MRPLKIIFVTFILITLNSCEVVQEVNFNEDKSGRYSLGLDFTEMMKRGMNSGKESLNKQVDTLIVFSDFIELKKDSISKLSKKERNKLKQLEDFSIEMKVDSVSNKFEMKINYDFDNLKELSQFGEKLKNQEIKELKLFSKNVNKGNMYSLNEFFTTTFNKNNFSLKMTPEGLEKAKKQKDTTLTEDNPMADLIRFRMKYTFPYKIKSVNNKNARILPDFKGLEFSENIFELNNNPTYFDIEVEFEKK